MYSCREYFHFFAKLSIEASLTVLLYVLYLSLPSTRIRGSTLKLKHANEGFRIAMRVFNFEPSLPVVMALFIYQIQISHLS